MWPLARQILQKAVHITQTRTRVEIPSTRLLLTGLLPPRNSLSRRSMSSGKVEMDGKTQEPADVEMPSVEEAGLSHQASRYGSVKRE